GHFLVAKWRGLHVDAFSIGFKKVWGKKINGVEYRIGCLPLGGSWAHWPRTRRYPPKDTGGRSSHPYLSPPRRVASCPQRLSSPHHLYLRSSHAWRDPTHGAHP
ncbi:MAG: site-2 protease family protein, partial [Alistipes sp.]|nr:site-2 protease family protein [Alistipes sp.]